MTVIGRTTLRKPYKPGRSTAVVLPAAWCRQHLTREQPFLTVTENGDGSLTVRHANVLDAASALPLDIDGRDHRLRPNNARTTPPDERIATLANNIQQIGLLNPITVRPLGNGYELVAGLGRLLAVRSLGWPEIPANVRPGNDTDSALARLSENVIRSNITPVEEAMQLHTLVEADDQGTIGVAIQLGRSQSWVEDRLDILTWPANLIAHVHEHRISLAAAKHLARISDPVTQTMYINDAARNGISARTAAQWRASANADAGDGPDPPDFSVGTPISPVQTTTFAICFCCRQPKSIDETRAARICSDCALQLGTAPTAETHTVVTQQPTAPTHHGNTARPLPDDEVHPRLLQTNPLPPPP